MKAYYQRLGAAALGLIAVFTGCGSEGATDPASPLSAPTTVSVSFSGGYDTNPVDNGRPVVLVAGALGVAPEVFRYAFSLVTPAPAGQEPDPNQVSLNKAALLSVLGPYGVTNDLLDTVSNYYRINGSAGEVWPRVAASATAVVTDGVVTAINITNGGAGYSSPPTVTVPGFANLTIVAALSFGKSFTTNGSIASLTIVR